MTPQERAENIITLHVTQEQFRDYVKQATAAINEQHKHYERR